MISNLPSHIEETELKATLRRICDRVEAPLFLKVQLLSALRIAYIVFPTTESASQVLNVSHDC